MEINNFIDGQWRASSSSETDVSRDPANPDEVVAEYQLSTEADAERAVEAADAAASEWSARPPAERAAYLRDAADRIDARREEFVGAIVREEGMARSDAEAEVQRTLDLLRYYAETGLDLGGDNMVATDKRSEIIVQQEPVGVAGLITPWNVPLAIPTWKMAPALVTGNTIVLKPSSVTPDVARRLVAVFEETRIPDGVVNLVTGSGSIIGGVLCSDERVDGISFTGSTGAGEAIYREAATDQKRVQLEMGGKNPTLVMPSADVDDAVDIVTAGAFGRTGQACTATSRALVHESIHDEFLSRLVEATENLTVGPGDEDPDLGPHVSESELESTLEYVDVGQSEGALLETGGERPDEPTSGYFVEPAVFSNIDPDSRLGQEEVFGPLVSVITVSDFEEGLEIANDVPYGLSASIVTDDLTEAYEFKNRIDAGLVKVNEKSTGADVHAPFGGMKASSSETYREMGEAGLDFFTLSKTTYVNF